MNKIYLVSYDIESNKLRLKLSKKLIAIGLTRIQYSLFLGSLSPTLYPKLMEALHQLWEDAKQNSDRIDVLSLSQQQIEKMVQLGGEHLDMDYITGQKHTLIL